MTTMPFIPEFTNYKERNKWIRDNAEYFTVVLAKTGLGSRQRAEAKTYGYAIETARSAVANDPDPNIRFLIYAVYQRHDTLVATVSSEGVKEHD